VRVRIEAQARRGPAVIPRAHDRPAAASLRALEDSAARRVPSTAAAVRRRAAPQAAAGPDAKPQRGGNAKGKKKGDDKPRGPIPMKNTGRSFTLDDVDAPDEALPDMDDVATSKPSDDLDKDDSDT
jgi:hypothetical protein